MSSELQKETDWGEGGRNIQGGGKKKRDTVQKGLRDDRSSVGKKGPRWDSTKKRGRGEGKEGNAPLMTKT